MGRASDAGGARLPRREGGDEEGHEVTMPAEFALPNVLVRLALEHDRVFTY
jgi:hypothetical protein